MALIDDYVTLSLLASSTFFVALSIGLLVRYRQVSQRISVSTDLGHDLWSALEQRMKKQDERILDMMGRLEVVQARMTTQVVLQPPVTASAHQAPAPIPEEPVPSDAAVTRAPSQPESQSVSQASQESQASPKPLALDGTQMTAIRLLVESPKNTRQLTDSLGKSREHTARIMKELFEMGLVERNDSTKPFVYQLTDAGRQYTLGT